MTAIDTLLHSIRHQPCGNSAQTLDVRVGPFWTVVQTSTGTGIASTMAGEARPHEGMPVDDAGALLTKTPLELAELLRSPSPTQAAIGLATVNALIGRPHGQVTGENALQILTRRCRGKKAAMFGRFPFAEKLRTVCDRLWVFERNDRLGPGVVSTNEAPKLLPHAQIVAVTATTLINGTLESILEHIPKDSWVMMLGPSTPMTSCLFDCGFDVLCGSYVTNPETVVAAVSQGATTKQITGVDRLSLWREG